MAKKKINKYSDSFRQVLKEYSDGGAYSPAGGGSINTTNSTSYGQTRKGQNPPFSTYTDAMGRTNTGTGIRTQSKDETEAPKIAPYPLQTVTDYLMTAYENLVNVRGHIDSSYDNPALTTTQQKELQLMTDKLDKILEHVQKLGDEILQIKLQQQ